MTNNVPVGLRALAW